MDLRVDGEVNGQAIGFSGVSEGVPGSGSIKAAGKTTLPLPRNFVLPLLSYVLLTGQPIMSKATEGTENPFEASGGVYSARRTLNLGSRGSLDTDYNVRAEAHGLLASFHVKGKVDVPELSSIEPTIETWVPDGPGRIRGHFSMPWVGADSHRLVGEASTIYTLPGGANLPHTQYRYIAIDVASSPTDLRQSERIVLFRAEKLADFIGKV